MKILPYQAIHNLYARIIDCLTGTNRRLWAGFEALELGYGGVHAVGGPGYVTVPITI
jgi:hypothetical protein